MQKTALYDRQCELKARMGEFAGWYLPFQYQGVFLEHQAVRKKAGLFDLSYRGRFDLLGKEAKEFADYLVTTDIRLLESNMVCYTTMADTNGIALGEVVILYHHDQHISFISSAGRSKEFQHVIEESCPWNVEIHDYFDRHGILSVQGPKSQDVLKEVLAIPDLLYRSFLKTEYAGQSVILARFGDTGELGFELYIPNQVIKSMWNDLLQSGKKHDLSLCGLEVKNLLRLEMGYPLYGQPFLEDISPIESINARTVDLKKINFIGKESMILRMRESKRKQHGLVLHETGDIRVKESIYLQGEPVGWITSKAYSPSLEKTIAIGLFNQPVEIGAIVGVGNHPDRLLHAEVVQPPFIQPSEAFNYREDS